MYIVDGIAYAGEPHKPIQVLGVRPLEDYRLWVRFGTGESRIFDFKPLLNRPGFMPLADESTFRQVYIDYGAATWRDGEIDIDPEWLYADSVPMEN